MNQSRRNSIFFASFVLVLTCRYPKNALRKYPRGQPVKTRDLARYIGMLRPDHIDLVDALNDLQWVIENDANLTAFVKMGGINAVADCLSV